jgi:hypothetical protein
MHPRPGKCTHDATFQILDGVKGKQISGAALVCNPPELTATDPGLMDTATWSLSSTSSAT